MRFMSRTSTSPEQQFETRSEYHNLHRAFETACQIRADVSPRSWQTRAALALHYKHNVMLVAATGSGKSMAYQSLPLLRPNGTVLVIAPLNQLMAQQVERMRQWGIQSVALTEATLKEDTQVYRRIAAGEYQVIFASPECTLATDGPLWGLLNASSFRKRLMYVAIDEVHLVLDWGKNFRPAYANITAIRPCLNHDEIPIIAMTATANVEKLKELCRLLQFDEEASILIRETTNRANICYAVKEITAGESASYVSTSDATTAMVALTCVE
jgi:ATP-dependent DNA helicase RecQ